MLAARLAPEFPLPDSIAWLRPEPGRVEALPVRIHQHAADGQVRVSAHGKVFPGEVATAFRRVDRRELYATEAEAIGALCKTCKGTGQRKRTRRGRVVKMIDCPTCGGAGRLFP